MLSSPIVQADLDASKCSDSYLVDGFLRKAVAQPRRVRFSPLSHDA
jgi:hypothetical protein